MFKQISPKSSQIGFFFFLLFPPRNVHDLIDAVHKMTHRRGKSWTIRGGFMLYIVEGNSQVEVYEKVRKSVILTPATDNLN